MKGRYWHSRIHVAGTKQFLSPEIAGMKLRKTDLINKGTYFKNREGKIPPKFKW